MLPASQSIALRPALPDDEDFLFEVFTSSRIDDLTSLNWPAEQSRDFLVQQYAAQRRFFQMDYPRAESLIVLYEGNRVGTMVVERGDQEIRIVDIALLPPHRNAGIATYLIRELLAEATRSGKVLRAQVIRSSPAVRLLERLGLVKTGETGSHFQLEARG
jgi:ribosomal protein S18 acetylase RimI-like enzyme